MYVYSNSDWLHVYFSFRFNYIHDVEVDNDWLHVYFSFRFNYIHDVEVDNNSLNQRFAVALFESNQGQF